MLPPGLLGLPKVSPASQKCGAEERVRCMHAVSSLAKED